MTVATYEDVGIALRRTITDAAEIAQINWWLTGIEMLIRGRLGDITLLDQDVVKYVEVEAVAEKVRRHGSPETSITVSVDDGTVTRRYDNQVSASDITDAWWELLAPEKSSDAFTINPLKRRGICR